MKYFIIVWLALACSLSAQSISFKIVELKGSVEIKDREGAWIEPHDGDLLLNGTELFTGLHSHVSIEVGEDSYITVNQLSNVQLLSLRVQKENHADVFLKMVLLLLMQKPLHMTIASLFHLRMVKQFLINLVAMYICARGTAQSFVLALVLLPLFHK